MNLPVSHLLLQYGAKFVMMVQWEWGMYTTNEISCRSNVKYLNSCVTASCVDVKVIPTHVLTNTASQCGS